jgi:hypothetical protein
VTGRVGHYDVSRRTSLNRLICRCGVSKPAFRLQISGFSDANRVSHPTTGSLRCGQSQPANEGRLHSEPKAPSLKRHARRRKLASGGLQLHAPLTELALGTPHAVEDEFVFRVEVRLPAILTRRQPGRVAVDTLRNDRDLRGAHQSDCTTPLRPYPREGAAGSGPRASESARGLQKYDPA